jgi:hypothetical protein
LELDELLKPDQLSTKTDLRQTEERLELKMAAQESRIISALTWRMILVMGAWTAVATSLFGFLGRVI